MKNRAIVSVPNLNSFRFNDEAVGFPPYALSESYALQQF